jgi:hypothetical protein
MNKNGKTYKVAIVVPIYRKFAELSANEMSALRQIARVLYGREIFFIYPPSLDPAEYIRYLEPLTARAVKIPAKFFGNLERNNRLLVSHSFYRHFAAFDFMLLHHTDAYVFSDQLDYWCSQDLDYIGAPWFEGKKDPVMPLKFVGVGNGGFSLRRISSFLKVTENRAFILKYFVSTRIYAFLHGHHYKFVRKYLGIDNLVAYLRTNIGYEDEFWGLVVPRFFKWFRVAKPEDALKFSFEVMPEVLLKLNNNELPFGCHAWEKYDPVFWKSFIPYKAPNQQQESPKI